MFDWKYASILNEYEKFWKRENTSRPILNLSYSVPCKARYRTPATLEEQWLDAEYRYAAFKHNLNASGYIAEGIPMFFTNFGPGCLAACMGGSYALAKQTIWFDQTPIVVDFENPPDVKFDENSEMWQHIVRLQNKLIADPSVHFSIPDLGGVMDIVASLRSTETLLYDLYDYPEEVKAFSSKVTDIWLEAFDLQAETVRKAGQPFNSWMNIPSSLPWYALQCDFSYMISPAQFEEFVLPDLVRQAGHMPRSIYHLDGVGEIPHVDMLLDIPELTGIQWTPGAGHEPLISEKWFPLYKKIQEKNKNLVLLGAINENNIEAAEPLIKTLDPTGFYISGGCASREKAECVLEKITRWSE